MTILSHVPITRIGTYLIVTVQQDLDDESIEALESRVSDEVVRRATDGLLLDLAGLEIVDSFVGRVVERIVSMVRLLGAATVVVGLRPAVAITLVELGLGLDGVPTALDAERGLKRLQQRKGRSHGA